VLKAASATITQGNEAAVSSPDFDPICSDEASAR
jgi:hypothetical protein